MKLLLDTHVLVWLLEGSSKISEAVHNQIQEAASEDQLGISAITPWEIAMLVAKGRLRLAKDVGEWLDAALALPGMRLIPLSPAIAVASTRLPVPTHADAADCILIATARNLDAALVTADQRILAYATAGLLTCIEPS